MLGHAIFLLSVGSALAGVSVRMPFLGTAGVTYNVPTQDVPFNHQFGTRISSVAYGNSAFLGRAYGAGLVAPGVAAYAGVPAYTAAAAVPLHATRLATAAVPVASTVHHVPTIAQVPFTKLEHQPAVVQSVVDVAKAKVATRKFEIRRPAIEKQFYDIEERVVVRPVGKAVVELDQPETKSQKGPTVIQPAVHAVSAAPPVAFAARTFPAFAARSSLALPAFPRTAHVYSYPFHGPSYNIHQTIAVSSTPAPAPQEESEPELIKPDDETNPQPENPIEPINPEPQQPYPPQQPDPQQPYPPQQPEPQPQPESEPSIPFQQPQQDTSDSDSESVSIDNPEISARDQQAPAAPAQNFQINEYENLLARQRSQALEQQLQMTRAQTEAQKVLLARLQAMSDAQEQLLTRSRQELQAQEDLLTQAKQQREQQILVRAREQQEQEQQLLTSVRQRQELMARARQQQEQDQQILARARQQQEIQARTALYGERINIENPAPAADPSPSQQGDSSSSKSRDGRMRNAAEGSMTQSLDVIPSTRLSAEESLSNQEKLIDLLTARGGIAEVRNVGEAGASVRGRVLSVTPAPERSSPLNERVNTRRVVVNRRIQTVQNIDVVEPFTKIERVAVHRPALVQTARVGVAHVPAALPVHTVHHAPAVFAYRH